MSSLLSRTVRSESARHLLLIAAISIGYESLFIRHFMNWVDEGLTLYAAMGLHRGGSLYQDVAFLFPPGHVLVAWIAYGLDPPGVVLSRILYAAFNVALCLALYPLACRLMPPRYALFGALLIALAAPLSHKAHLIFGYRYLVFSALALLAFAQRLRTGEVRWMLAAGLCVGVAVCFRLTPAFAAAVGIGLGVLASAREPRVWLRDGLWFAAGGVVVVVPIVAVYAQGIGLEGLWREVVVRPVVMTDLQSLPIPALALPEEWTRDGIHDAFVALLFRICALVYVGSAVWLCGLWLRSLAAGRRFEHPLLLAVVLWGGVYYLRSLGRSDEPHLSSTIPPFCVLSAYLLYRSNEALGRVVSDHVRQRAALAAAALLLAVWVFVPGADRALHAEYRGETPFEALRGRVMLPEDDWWHKLAPKLREIRARTGPDDRILDLTTSPLLYVLVNRLGPGHHDVVMPGVFLDESEERAFVAQLESAPPALVIFPAASFDEMKSRSLARIAPILMPWIGANYHVFGDPEECLLLEPRPLSDFGGSDAGQLPVTEAIPTEPLDLAQPLDRMLAELASELDAYQVTDLLLRLGGLETRLGWFEGSGAFAEPPSGIGIGRELASLAQNAPSLESLREPLRLVLAHQQAHGMQSRIYTRESLARPGNQSLVEAQADVLAGITLAQNKTFADVLLQGVREEAVRGVAFSRQLGRVSGRERETLSDPVRLRLLQIGRNVGVYYFKVWNCATNLGEPVSRVVFEAARRSLLADVRRNPDLPAFDGNRCEAEDVFDWTLRAAAREVARDSAATDR